MKKLIRKIVEKSNIVGYRLNNDNNIRIRRNDNKRRRDPNHNQENYLEEAIATNQSKLGGYGSTITGGTGSILIAGV